MSAPADSKKDAAEGSQQTAPATDEQETPVIEPALPGESAAQPAAAAEAESKKKFTKKY
jgi:hypothetical protein